MNLDNSVIFRNYNQNQVDPDSYNIIMNYLEDLEEEEKAMKRKYHQIYTGILADLHETVDSTMLKRKEGMYEEQNIIKVSYGSDILRQIQRDRYLDKLLFNDLSYNRKRQHEMDYYSEEESLYDEDDDYLYSEFTGWMNGASCDI